MSASKYLSSFPTVWKWLNDHPHPSLVANLQGNAPIITPVYKSEDHWKLPSENLPHEALSSYLATLTWNPTQGYREYTYEGKHYIFVPLPPEHASYPKKRVSKQFGLTCARYLKDNLTHLKELTFIPSPELSLPEVLNGWFNGLYDVQTFKSSTQKSWSLEKVHVLHSETATEKDFTDALKDQMNLAQAQTVTRYLGDAPANHMTPKIFAEIAQELATHFGFEVEVIGKEQLKEWGMNALLSVSQGSENPPQVIIARVPTSTPGSSKPVALVGKGVTFDSGGISLKPPSNMHEMKYDMLGGATMMGAICHVATHKNKLPYDVVALIGCVENMPAYGATRPGDVVTSYGGKTIEILNTDAEGRLVLADLLGYAQKVVGAGAIINTATLTGACLVALGSVGAALMAHHKPWKEYVQKMADGEGEPLWELPLWQDLSKAMDSPVADLKNIAAPSVRAGTIAAGIFLSKFVEEKTPWAHIDIAGVGWDCQSLGYPQKGASGYGVDFIAQAALQADSFYSS